MKKRIKNTAASARNKPMFVGELTNTKPIIAQRMLRTTNARAAEELGGVFMVKNVLKPTYFGSAMIVEPITFFAQGKEPEWKRARIAFPEGDFVAARALHWVRPDVILGKTPELRGLKRQSLAKKLV